MYSPGFLSYHDIRGEADEFLAEYNSAETLPVPIEAIVEFDLDIEVIPILGIKQDLQTDAFLASDLSAIYVDEEVMKTNPGRFRFSLAHEIGHYWLHDELYQGTKIESVSDWRRVQSALGEGYRYFEAQANNFAGLVLVPATPLENRFRSKAAELARVGIRGDAISREPARSRLIEWIASEFGVSTQTAGIRLERDGLLLSADQLIG
jgi:Zn-dependent peptidase ImmA (M78 family)